jgi:hypothetical protein
MAAERAKESDSYTDSETGKPVTKKTPQKSSLTKEDKQKFLKDKLGMKPSTAKKAVQSDSDDFE